MEQTAKQVGFRGHVQGVGFRYTACRIALKYELTGFVRNRPDGTVEALMQGTEHAISMCIAEIKDHFGHHIREVKLADLAYNPRYTDFQITY